MPMNTCMYIFNCCDFDEVVVDVVVVVIVVVVVVVVEIL